MTATCEAPTLPSTTIERIAITNVRLFGHPTPASEGIPVETALSDAASRLALRPDLDDGDFEPASWVDEETVLTPLLGPVLPGTYGLWVRFTVGAALAVRFAGPANFV